MELSKESVKGVEARSEPGRRLAALGFSRGRFDDTYRPAEGHKKYTYAVEKAELRTRPRFAGRPGFGGSAA